jgi:hypothetical protein
VSGNPGGRPKGKPFEDELRKVATPAELAAIAKAVIAKAKKGDMKAAEFLADRLDGRLPLPLEESKEGSGSGPVVFVSGFPRTELPAAEAEGEGEE